MISFIIIFCNYLFCFFSIFYSLKILRKRNYRSILAFSNIAFVIQNMIGIYWFPSYLSELTSLSFDNNIYQTMIFYHALQSLIFVCGISTYHFKFSYLGRLFIRMVASLTLLFVQLQLFVFGIIYQFVDYLILLVSKQLKNDKNKLSKFSTTNLTIVNGEYSTTILISSLISFSLSIILVLRAKVTESVSSLFLNSYSSTQTYSIRLQQSSEGFGFNLFGAPSIDQFLPHFYFNFSPFLSIYYLLLFLYATFLSTGQKM